jgi:hypothetical protein
MSHRFFAAMGALAVVIAVALPAAVPVAGQVAANTTGAAKAWTVPRTPDGQPDLQGIWSNATLTPLERPRELAGKPFFTQEEAAEYEKRALQQNNADRRDNRDTEADVALAYNDSWYERGTKVVPTRRTSLIVDPPDGRIPALTSEGEKRRDAGFCQTGQHSHCTERGFNSWEDRNLWERCITRGLPIVPAPYNNNHQILQTSGYVVILSEMIHDARIISVDGRPHIDNDIRQWMGDSRGRWEGSTLVVDTTNFTDKTNFSGSGANLHLVERFTRLDANTLLYEFTVDDPTTFTRPWTAAVPMIRAPGPIYEYACHEGNYGMTNLLSGARAEEKAKKEAAKKASR